MISWNDGGSHHDLPVAAAARQYRAAAGFEPAVQRTFFWRSRAATRAAPLQSRVPNRFIVASKCDGHAVAIDGGFTNRVVSFSLNVEFGVMVLAGPFLGAALAIRAACRTGVICAA